jgi:hypothetical protein
MVLLLLWLNIVIAPRFVTLNVLHNKILLPQSSPASSRKLSLVLVVAVVAQVAVVLVVVLEVAIVLVVAVVVVMVLALVQSLALVVVAAVIAQAIILNLAPVNPVHLATHVLLLALIVLLIHVLHDLVTHARPATHVLRALVTRVRLLAPALLNPKLVDNAEALAATKHGSPFSSPFCMESSRFR